MTTRSDHVRDWLLEAACRTLNPQDQARVDAHLSQCARCAAELDGIAAGYALLGEALPPVRASDTVLPGLLAAAARGARATPSEASLDEFAGAIAELYGVSEARAQEILRYLAEPSQWMPGPSPGIEMMMVETGGAYAHHLGTIVRVAPGETFPWHEHLGEERFFVLQGACVEPDGTCYRAGDAGINATGTAHDFVAVEGGPAFVFAVRLEKMMRFGPRP